MDTTVSDSLALFPITDTPFRANAGGVAIGVNEISFNVTNVNITVINCTFIRNRAQPSEQDRVSTSELFVRSIFIGRGGGLGIFIRESVKVEIVIQDCYFESNFATTFGGGMYVLMDGAVSNHFTRVTGSKFIDNECQGGGGGLHTGYFLPTTALHSVEATNCTFIGNRALLGGGSYIFPGIGVGRVYSATYISCHFKNNYAEEYGAALGLFSLDFFEPREGINAYVIEDW